MIWKFFAWDVSPGQEGNQFFGFRGNITHFSAQTIGRLDNWLYVTKSRPFLKIRDIPTGRSMVILAQYNFFQDFDRNLSFRFQRDMV